MNSFVVQGTEFSNFIFDMAFMTWFVRIFSFSVDDFIPSIYVNLLDWEDICHLFHGLYSL